MMDLETISSQVSTHLLTVGQSSLRVLVLLFAAVLILVLGLYISRLVGSYAKKILNKISFDEKTSKLGINELCVRFGLGKSPTYIIAFVLAWAVIFYAIVLAADVLHLEIIRDLSLPQLLSTPTPPLFGIYPHALCVRAYFVCGPSLWQANGQHY